MINDSFIPSKTYKADKISEDEFMKLIEKQYKEEQDPRWNSDFDDTYIWNWADLVKSSEFAKSNISFSMENCDDEDNSDDEDLANILGLTTLSNGIPIYGFIAGGDWEIPLYACFYPCNNHISIYVPCRGNAVNLDYKSAFGSEDNYCGAGSEPDYGDEDVSEYYLKKYGLTTDDDLINGKAIREELEKVLVPFSKATNDFDQAVVFINFVFDEIHNAKTFGDLTRILNYFVEAAEKFEKLINNNDHINESKQILHTIDVCTDKAYDCIKKFNLPYLGPAFEKAEQDYIKNIDDKYNKIKTITTKYK